MNKRLFWMLALPAAVLLVLLGVRVYDQTPRFRKIKDEDKTVRRELGEVLRLPVFKETKLKLVARERAGRSLVARLDGAEPRPWHSADLARGVVLELPPGDHALRIELADGQGGQEFQLVYTLYEFR